DGRTWSAPVRVFPDPPGRPTTHSVRISRLTDGPDEVVAFGGLNYRDDPEGHLINIPGLGYGEMDLIMLRSHDRGQPRLGPTKIVELPDGRILAAYRRNDKPGLWGTIARIDGDRWINEQTGPLWQGAESGMSGEKSRGEELATLKFGFPQMVVRPDGDVMLVF